MSAQDVIDIAATYGTSGIVLMLALYFLMWPEKVEQVRTHILKPFFNLFGLFGKAYIASDVASQANTFIRQHLASHLPLASSYRLRIKWVSSPSDPILSEDGTLLLRLRDTEDRTRNILSATKVALPRIICPSLRSELEPAFQEAIDLALLRRLSLKIGKHSLPIFAKHFLSPCIAADTAVQALFERLVELDNRGVFVPIFLSELHFLEDQLAESGRSVSSEIMDSIGQLLEFLLPIARRKLHEEVELDHTSATFRIGIVLLARSIKAEQFGISPYIDRVGKHVAKGMDSIYMVAFPPAYSFFEKVQEALISDHRLELTHLGRMKVRGSLEQGGDSSIKMILLRRLSLLGDVDFPELCAQNDISPGGRLNGRVLDTSQRCALIDACGINCVLPLDLCSWRRAASCHDFVSDGETKSFWVDSIDSERHRVVLSLRDPDADPWVSGSLPSVGDVVDVTFDSIDGRGLHGALNDLNVVLPLEEVSWGETIDPSTYEVWPSAKSVRVISLAPSRREVICSLRALTADPWPQIAERLPPGTTCNSIVVSVNRDFVTVRLAEYSIEGRIPRAQMLLGGHEYLDFENTVVPGQGLHVVVNKVFVGKRKISLDLQRNRSGLRRS